MIIIFKNGPLNGSSITSEDRNKYIVDMNQREYTYINTGEKDMLGRVIFEIKEKTNLEKKRNA